MNDNWRRNLLLMVLFFIATIYSAYQENYWPIPWPFSLVLIGGAAVSIWMALKVSTPRLLSLMVVIFIIEYVKETIGVRSGMWAYYDHFDQPNPQYNFGICAWVLAGMSVYWLAVRLVIPSLRKLKEFYGQWNPLNPNLVIVVLILALIPLTVNGYGLSAEAPIPEAPFPGWIWWFWGLYAALFAATLQAAKGEEFRELFGYRISPNLAIVLLVIVIIPLTLGPYGHPQNQEWLGWLIWSLGFYLVLLLVTLETANRMDSPVFLGLLLTTWVVAIISEYTGAIHNHVWRFTYNPDDFPPLFLVIGFWPLEIFTQYRLSAVLAKEPLDRYTGSESPEPFILAPTHLTKEENHLRLVLQLSAITYLAAGLAFALFPRPILRLIDGFGAYFRLIPALGDPIPYADAHFWLSLAFSMMMTITYLCYMAQFNVRKNKGFVKALLVAKAASSLSSLGFILLHKPAYFASLVILLVDGSIFLITFYFYNKANQSLTKAQSPGSGEAKPPQPPQPAKTGLTTVAAFKGDEKLVLLDQVLEATQFFDLLKKRFQESGKSNKKDFKVVIKPNFMFMHSRHDISTYTDPELVEGLVARIYDRGFTNITLVEAQSTYGNYYKNRDVLSVARYVGYPVNKDGSTPHKKYRMVDLTKEMVPYNYGKIPEEQDPLGFCRKLGRHYVGPTWRHADFRISFAKNKTHCFCHYTLTLKNIYGTLPMQNKLKEYHTKREYDWPTIASLTHFPVHFGLIDAFTSADGQFGVIMCPDPKLTMTIIGGENLMAVDWVGAEKMGLDPDNPQVGRFLPLAMAAFGKPEINRVGDLSVYQPWENVREEIIESLDVIEEAYVFSNWWFGALTSMDPYFAFTWRGWAVNSMRWILAPFKKLFYEEIEI